MAAGLDEWLVLEVDKGLRILFQRKKLNHLGRLGGIEDVLKELMQGSLRNQQDDRAHSECVAVLLVRKRLELVHIHRVHEAEPPLHLGDVHDRQSGTYLQRGSFIRSESVYADT